MEKDFFVSTLNDVYGSLLTDKQQQMVNEYYNLDYSLAEIAENFGITRQAVHFSVKQATDALYMYESKLNLAKKMVALQLKLNDVMALLDNEAIVEAKLRLKEIENNLRSYYGTV